MQKPQNFYCAKKTQNFELNFGFKFNIIQKIGEGSYGQIFKIFDIEKQRLLIVKRHKVSKTKDGISLFENQHNILEKLSKVMNNMYVGEYVKQVNQQYFYMDCFGDNLEDLITKHKNLSVRTVKHIGLKVVQQLQSLHNMGYLHRDIKSQNILIGNQGTLHNIYLIDYGLALKFKNDNIQISKRRYQGLVGTARYASLSAHQHFQQSPKDDLESLGYVLLFCLKGSLSWMNLQIQDKIQKFKKIEQLKKQATLKELGFNFPFLIKYFKYIKQLKYEDIPNYTQIKKLFNPIMKQDECFQWCDTKKCKCRVNNQKTNRNLNIQENFKIKNILELTF